MSTKHELLAEHLRKLIRTGRAKPGELLPSQAELMKDFDISLSTVRQALGTLSQEGWIKPEHGRGVVVISAQPSASSQRGAGAVPAGRYGFAVWDSSPRDPSSLMILDGLSEALAEHDAGLLFGAFDSREPGQRERLLRFARSCTGLFLSGVIDDALLRDVRDLGVPWVLAGHATDESLEAQASCIAFDAEAAGYLAAQILCMHGHREIALHLPCRLTTYQFRLEAGFARACRESGRTGHVWVEVDDAIVARRLRGRSKITGAVVMGDPVACGLIERLRPAGAASGGFTPIDCSVIAVGSRPRDDLSVPQLSRLAFSCHELGRACAGMLIERPGQMTRRLLAPRIEMGSTVHAPRPADARLASEPGK